MADASVAADEDHGKPQRLRKQLRLIDIYATSAGAMFSSGFFLLPGIAAAQAGPAVVAAYLLAGLAVIPAMLSASELSTAMPRAGGAYYFLDRSMGPLVGTVGGIGNWVALVSKSAFALVGMSAYIAFFADVPVQPVAVGLTLAFMVVNIVGVKATTRLQVVLVSGILLVLGAFVVAGVLTVTGTGLREVFEGQFTPFLPFGTAGLLATVGLVVVSYSGPLKIASLSEEADNPSRNIPLAMILSVATAIVIYGAGVTVMVGTLDAPTLRDDLTPVLTAAEGFLPPPAVLLVAVAAVAAFLSATNAGMLSAARYPLAMARDRLVWRRFANVGRFGTPTSAVVATAVAMAVLILALDVEAIAKVASAFILLVFGLVNLAVVVMRESRIDAYDPGFYSPWYPWTQLAGMLISVVLIVEMGLLSVLLTAGVSAGAITWYLVYARSRVDRDGAIYHIFERLGRRRHEGLEHELLGILQEEGLRVEDRFEDVVARAAVVDLPADAAFQDAVQLAADRLASRLGTDASALIDQISQGTRLGATPLSYGVALPHVLLEGVEHPEMVMVRSRAGLDIGAEDGRSDEDEARGPVHALFFVAGERGRAGRLLRILGQLAAHVEDPGFLEAWHAAGDEQRLKEVVLADQRFVSIRVRRDSKGLSGRALRDVGFPPGCLVALVQRDGHTLVPQGSTVLEPGDRLTIVGDPSGVRRLTAQYRDLGGD